MEDPLEWQEYKDKVEELTRELEELKGQVEGLSGEAAEDSGLLYLGEDKDSQRQMVVHYAGNLGEGLSADDYGAVRDAFEDFVKSEDGDRARRMEVRHGDMIAGTLGADGDRVYALVTIADEDKLAGMQNMGPPPYAGVAPWSYHIYSFSSCCECACTDPHADTLNFVAEGWGELDWGCVTYDTGACAYVATTTPTYPTSNFFGEYTMTCEYKADRGWTITVTGEGIGTDPAVPDGVYHGAGSFYADDPANGGSGVIDYSQDFKPCDVDIPNTTGRDGVGVFSTISSSLTVTSCTIDYIVA